MSGALIISSDEIIGVYVGGPPIPGQLKMFKLMQAAMKSNYENLESLVKDLIFCESFYEDGFLTRLLRFMIILLRKVQGTFLDSQDEYLLQLYRIKSIKRLSKIVENEAHYTLYNAVCRFKSKDAYIANVGISVRNRMFNRIKEIVGNFENLQTDVTSIENLIVLVTK